MSTFHYYVCYGDQIKWMKWSAVMMTSQLRFKCTRAIHYSFTFRIDLYSTTVFHFQLLSAAMGKGFSQLYSISCAAICEITQMNTHTANLKQVESIAYASYRSNHFMTQLNIYPKCFDVQALWFVGPEKSIILVINKFIAMEWTWRQISKQT